MQGRKHTFHQVLKKSIDTDPFDSYINLMTEINTISNTAYYCCGIRMEDASSKRPVCNDQFAERFMDERGLEIYEPFKSEILTNISNIARCRIFDEILQHEINKHSDTIVITIGAGFDTRPYRLQGARWIELDEPHLIDYKNEKLPISECNNDLQRIPINFASETIKDKLQSIDNKAHLIIVIEGVFMYLEQQNIKNTIDQLQSLFSKHILLCDLMNEPFFEKYAKPVHSKLVASGGTFTERPVKPAQIFIDNNYIEKDCIPMVVRARQLGMYRDYLKIPGFIVDILLLTKMKDLKGYAVHRFHYGH